MVFDSKKSGFSAAMDGVLERKKAWKTQNEASSDKTVKKVAFHVEAENYQQ